MNILESVRFSGSKVQIFAIALPLAALLLTGCPIYTDNGHPVACRTTGDCTAPRACIAGTCQLPPCRSDADCTAPQVCGAGGMCTAPQCTSNAMCMPTEVCTAMHCVPGPRSCETHGDCDAGSLCDAQLHCATSTTCRADADCTMSGFWCDFRNTCVPHTTGQCRTRTDCTGGALCIEGSCTLLPATCQFAYDCPAGTSCVNAQCTAVCTTDRDCTAGDVCNTVSHYCEAMVNCATTAMCPATQHCVGGRCLADCHATGATCGTAGVRQTAYCASDMFCHPSWQPAQFCPATACATGRTCLSHVCRTPCPMGATSVMAGNAQCAMIDSTLPFCRMDTASGMYLCNETMSSTPGCRTSADCTTTARPTCVNAQCQ